MFLLYIPNREVFRMLALEIFEKELDFTHILFNVVRRGECLAQGDGLCRKIDACQHDGDTCSLGDVIESAFPIRIGSTCSLRCDGQMKLVALLGQLDDIVHQRGLQSRYTGMPPIQRKIGPSGQKNQSFFIMKPASRPMAP